MASGDETTNAASATQLASTTQVASSGDPSGPLVGAARAMLDADAASTALGITIAEVALGHAVLTMAVTDAMVNGLEVCHGGIIFTLADTAMAVASNTCGSRTLASSAAIEFLAPARIGDVLTATCDERVKPGRSALNDTTVVNQEGETIAEFRGRTVTVGDR